MERPEKPNHPRNGLNCSCCCCCNYLWIVEYGLTKFLTDPDTVPYWRSMENGEWLGGPCVDCHYMLNWRLRYNEKCAVKTHGNKADANTEYTFTLTMPPGYNPKKPIEEAAKLIMMNGLTNKPYEKPEKWAYVLEHTAAGTPHIHGMYKTPSGRRIAAKYFNRYWSLWKETDDEGKPIKLGNGHQGGYHAKARHSESYLAYMSKEGCVHSSEKISLV